MLPLELNRLGGLFLQSKDQQQDSDLDHMLLDPRRRKWRSVVVPGDNSIQLISTMPQIRKKRDLVLDEKWPVGRHGNSEY